MSGTYGLLSVRGALDVQVGQKYHVLCVLTDGIINDMVSIPLVT